MLSMLLSKLFTCVSHLQLTICLFLITTVCLNSEDVCHTPNKPTKIEVVIYEAVYLVSNMGRVKKFPTSREELVHNPPKV